MCRQSMRKPWTKRQLSCLLHVQREQTGESRMPDMPAPDAFPFASQVFLLFHALLARVLQSRECFHFWNFEKTARSKFKNMLWSKILNFRMAQKSTYWLTCWFLFQKLHILVCVCLCVPLTSRKPSDCLTRLKAVVRMSAVSYWTTALISTLGLSGASG